MILTRRGHRFLTPSVLSLLTDTCFSLRAANLNKATTLAAHSSSYVVPPTIEQCFKPTHLKKIAGNSPQAAPRSHHPQKGLEIPVSAYFIGNRIDLAGVKGDINFRQYQQGNTRNSVLFRIPSQSVENMYLHVIVFKYGSLVFFNAKQTSAEHDDYIDIIKTYTAEPLKQPNEDVHILLIRPKMSLWHQHEDNRVILKVLDLDNIKVISSVLGQSVALDRYSKKADQALEEFRQINTELMRSGKFSVDRRTLFKMIARNNMMITEAIITLGLLDRSDTAWTDDKYYDVWSLMQEEYELATRFAAMDKKLMLIQQNAKHFIEILQDNKSNLLEILIIVLISAEIVVMLFDIVHR